VHDLLVTPRNITPKQEHAGGQRLAGYARHWSGKRMFPQLPSESETPGSVLVLLYST
jgi:hypothetical protein